MKDDPLIKSLSTRTKITNNENEIDFEIGSMNYTEAMQQDFTYVAPVADYDNVEPDTIWVDTYNKVINKSNLYAMRDAKRNELEAKMKQETSKGAQGQWKSRTT